MITRCHVILLHDCEESGRPRVQPMKAPSHYTSQHAAGHQQIRTVLTRVMVFDLMFGALDLKADLRRSLRFFAASTDERSRGFQHCLRSCP